MKMQAKRRLAFALFLCLLAALGVTGLNHFAAGKLQRERWIVVANARTAVAAIRYLLEPDLPVARRYPSEWDVAETNLPQTIRAASQTPSAVTNITIILNSNGVATTQSSGSERG